MALNTAVYTGESGVVAFDVGGSAQNLASVRSFSVDQETAAIECTTTGDSGRQYKAGQTSFSGSMDLYQRDSDTGHNALFSGIGAAPATIELYPSGKENGIRLSGEVIITGHSLSTSFDGMVEVSVTFQGVGTLTKATVS